MNELVKEWLAKSDADFRTAIREVDVTEGPNYDAVCFHAQQCIEKLFKAMLLSFETSPARVHDLNVLFNELQSHIPLLSWPEDELRFLTQAAVVFRYPGESSDKPDAEEAVRICRALRQRIRPLLVP